MFALLAVICFAVVLFHGHLGDVNLVVLGLLFVALHLLVDYRPWAGRIGPRP